MSINLAVKLTCPVRLESLMRGTEKSLQEILGVLRKPVVQAEGSPASASLVSSTVLDSSLGTVRLTIRGFDDDPVFLFASDRSGDPEMGKGRNTFGIVEVHGDSIGVALAAAVALAISLECGSEIEDSRPYFTSSFEQSPESFLKKIRLENITDDLDLAAEEFRRSIAQKSTTR